MKEPEPLEAALRFGEQNGYFVEMVTVAKDGAEYEVPRVFWNDYTDTVQEVIRLRQIIIDAVAHGVYENNNQYWNAMVEVWRDEQKELIEGQAS